MIKKKRKTGQKKKSAPRKKAESKLKRSKPKTEVASQEEFSRIIHELEIKTEELRLSQAMLEESRSRYADLYDSAPVGYFTLDMHGVILEVNLTGADLIGEPRTRLLKKPFPVYVDSDSRDAFFHHMRKVVQQKERQESELKLTRKIGSAFAANMESHPYVDDAVRMVVIDITERKQAELSVQKSREDLSRAQEVGSIGSWRLDVRKNVLTWSDETFRIFGITKGTPLSYEVFLTMVHPDDREYVDMKWKAALNGEDYDIEHRIVVDGQTKWIHEKAYLEFDKDGALLGGFGIAQDVSDRKRVEDDLRASEKAISEVLASISDAFVSFDTEWRYTYVNEQAEKMLRTSKKQMIGRKLREAFPEAAESEFDKQFRRSVTENRVVRFESYYGPLEKWYACSCYPSPGGLSVYFQDVTDRKSVEEELRKHREHLIDLVDERTQDLRLLNEELEEEVRIRKEAEEITRVTSDLLRLFLKKSSRKSFLDAVVRIILPWSGCRNVGIRILHDDGTVPYESYTGFDREFLETESPLSTRDDQCACIRVITGHIETQDAPAMTKVGSFRCNNTLSFVLGLTEEEKGRFRGVCVSRGYKSVAVVPIRFRERTFGAIHLADEREDRVPRDMVESLEKMTPLIGEALFRFEMEEELQMNYWVLHDANQLMELMFSSMHILIAYMDSDFNFIRVNRAYAIADGKEPEFYIRKNHFDLFPNDENERIFREVVRTGEPYFAFEKAFEYVENPERETTYWDWSLLPVKEKDGRIAGLLLSLLNVTERRQARAEAVRAAHMAALGEMAAGMAHEVNNPVNGIINYAQMIHDEPFDGALVKDLSTRIINEGDRVADIVRGLLSFSREGRDRREMCKISDILNDTLSLSGAQLMKDDIDLSIHIDPDLPEINVDPGRIQQVFLNVVNNARYALLKKYSGEGGDRIFKITAKGEVVGDRKMVRTTFVDYGTGIPAESIGKVMDPFFTTKPTKDGTGLGLSISHGIISEHGGSISIDSVEGEYTNVIIDLPAVDGKAVRTE